MDTHFDHNLSKMSSGNCPDETRIFDEETNEIKDESENCAINGINRNDDGHIEDTLAYNRPSQFVDTVLAGNTYDIKNIEIAPFMAGSLREIVLSEEFPECPKVIRRKIMHFSFLMHAVCRYENFDSVYNIHCKILDDITLQKASWTSDDYFEAMEGRILSKLFEENMKNTASMCKIEANPSKGESDDITNYNDEESFDCSMPLESSEFFDENNDNDNDIDFQDIKTESKASEPKKIKKVKKVKVKKKKKKLLPLPETETDGPSTEVYCEECDKNITLFGDESLKKHNYRVHKQKVTCPYCAKIIFSEKWLQTHILKAHKNEKLPSYLCSVCGFESANYDEYNEHIKNHKLEQCHICQRSFKEKKILRLHIKKTHVNQNKEVCPYCGKFYKYVKAHIYSHHTTREMKKCSVCDYTANIQSVIDYHYSRVHEGKSEKCPECGIFVKHLKNHLRRGCASRPPQRNHHCTECDKQFSQSYQLKRHFNNIHMKIRDQLCTFCAYKTTTPFNLKIHIARVHEGRKLKSECKFCGKEVYSLDWHIQHHHQREVLSGMKGREVVDEKIGLIQDNQEELIGVHKQGGNQVKDSEEKTRLLSSLMDNKQNATENYSRNCEYLAASDLDKSSQGREGIGEHVVHLQASHLQQQHCQTNDTVQHLERPFDIQIVSIHRKPDDHTGERSKGLELQRDY